jgi:hypothetical protein
MGLRNGEVLNTMCPGANGPSDIDHVLHNGRHEPEERIVFFEYKNGAPVPEGQRWLLNSLRGNWVGWDEEKGKYRMLTIRYTVLPQHPSDAKAELRPIVEWLWPRQGEEEN